MRTFKTFVSVVVAIGLLSTGISGAKSDVQYSGFLENYPDFKPDEDRKGALTYRVPGYDLKPYSKIILAPVEIWIAPDSKYKGIKPDELKALADAFRQAIIAELEPTYPVVSKPGPDVLGIRVAITNLKMTKKKRGLLGYTPVGLVVSAGAKRLGSNMSLEDAAIEAEVLDSQTNKRLGAIIDYQSKTGKKKSSLNKLKATQSGQTSWEKIQQTLQFYAKRFRERMDKDHGIK